MDCATCSIRAWRSPSDERRRAAPRRELLPLGGQRSGGSRKRGGPMSALLAVDQLTTSLGPEGPEILSSVSITLRAGEVLGVVGESGAGKSMLALSIMGLLPHPITVRGGRVLLEDRDLLQL